MTVAGVDRLDELVTEAAHRHGRLPALVSAAGETMTYAELVAASRRLCARLIESGCPVGFPALLAVDNQPQDVVGELAIWLAGGVVVPVARSAPAAVLHRIAERTGARVLVGDDLPAAWSTVLTGPMGAAYQAETDAVGAAIQVRLLPARAVVPSELDSDQALVIFTSGSTGEPKGVVISHRAFARKLAAIDSVLPFATGTVTLQVLHLHFSFGQWTTLLTLATGGVVHLRPRFSTTGVAQDLATRQIDRIAVVPSMLRLLVRHLDGTGPQPSAAWRSPRLWIAGGEPLPAAVGRTVRRLFPHAGIADVFGLSESATSDLILTPDRYDAEAGTMGRPTPGVRTRVVGEDGADCRVGVDGELWLHTDHLMTGYLGDRAATDAALAAGWLRTGDRARRRADGLLELTGRAKDTIVRGGVKIAPLEVEDVYSGHPHAAGCMAVGVADELLGERLHLLMVARSGVVPDPSHVLAWGRERLDRQKVPDRVHFVDELPSGRTGKLDRGAARSVAAGLSSKD